MTKPRKKKRGHKRSCNKKQRFDTLDKARAASKQGGRWDFMEAYKCKKCGYYHYGHPKPKKFFVKG